MFGINNRADHDGFIIARYIIRASFSQERMTYLPEESKVIYGSKNG
jgi:hypothetical protein